MNTLKNKLRDSQQRTHQKIQSWLRPKVGAIGIKYRIAARVRLANKWATKHPKRTFVLVTGTLLFLLIGSMAIDNTIAKNETPQAQVSDIANMDPLLNGFRAIQASKSREREAWAGLADKGQRLRRELDSLIAIPLKTHADSIHIIINYRQLEKVVEIIKNNHTDETQN